MTAYRRYICRLQDRQEVLAAMDLFVVPTVTFNLLCGFFVIHHARRVILHFNATYHSTAAWVAQSDGGAGLFLPCFRGAAIATAGCENVHGPSWANLSRVEKWTINAEVTMVR